MGDSRKFIAMNRARSQALGRRRLGLPTRMAAMELAAVALACSVSAHGLDPSRPAASYLRTTFTVEDGLSSNVVNAIVQTRNGFLWIATDAGLDRFDGRHFTPIYFRGPSPTPQGTVSALAEGPDGDLWIGTSAGLVRVARAALDRFDRSLSVFYHPGAGISDEITVLHVTRAGVLLVGTAGGLYRFAGNHFETVIPHDFISRIEESADGHLLIISSKGFIELDGAHVVPHSGLADQLGVDLGQGGPGGIQVFHVFQDRSGVFWYGTGKGLARGVHGSVELFQPYHEKGRGFQRVYEDPQGNIWAYSFDGVFRVAGTKLEPLVTGTLVRSIFADAEGNLWIGTNGDGLVRFKDRPIHMFTKADGLPSNIPMAVLSRRDGSLWVGNNCGGLSVFNGQRFRTYAEKEGLTNSCVWTLAEDHSGVLWVGTWGGGLFRFDDGHFVQFTARQGLPDNIVRAIIVAHDGSLWIATGSGLSHMVDGQFHNYTTADGLTSNRVVSVYQDRQGTIWVGTGQGINRMTGNRFVPVPSPRQIFDPRYVSFGEDSSGDLYAISAPKGIGRIEGNQLVDVNRDLDLLSMVATPRGDLWFSAGDGILRFSAAAFRQNQADPENPPDYAMFGQADGMISTQCSIGAPNMALAPDGKLWVATVQGLAVLDLAHLSFETDKPRVFVEDVTVGRTERPAGSTLVLPPGTHHVELRFDSVSLSSPERIRFQYRMDGVDPVWLDADKSLTAVYTDIPVGRHAFRVRASNSTGVWDRVGISFPVTQKPYFYETGWFRAACAVAFFLLLWLVYLFRVRRLRSQERKLRDVVETIPAFVWTARPDGSIDFANYHWEEFSGSSAGKTAGPGWLQALHPEDLDRHTQKWGASVSSGEPFEIEARLRCAHGEYRWFLVRAVAMRGAHGRIAKWYGTTTDIEDRKRAEMLRAELAHVNRITTMGELMASISHELKQPIGASMLTASTALNCVRGDKPDWKDVSGSLENIVSDGKRAAEIIDRLRALYRKSPPQREPLDVNEIISEMVVLLRSEAIRCAVSTRTNLAGGLPSVIADRVQIQQVLMNLMLNGIEAMSDTGGVLTVKSQLGADSKIDISVSDTGPGLPHEKSDQIFEAFFTTKPQGSGMGLAICKSIVESHGGRIWASDNGGRGATFHFALPATAD
jgi:PAS domain S-box-containing protein